MRLWLPLFAAFVFAVFFAMSAPPCAADTFAYLPKSDGTIARFRVNPRTGELVTLSGATETGIKKPITLALSADKRFLTVYHPFNPESDGFNWEFETKNRDHHKAERIKPSDLAVFAIEAGGALRLVQSLVLPGPIGDLAFHPNGRIVYALTIDGAFVLRVPDAASGKLAAGFRIDIDSGMTPSVMAGERYAWGLNFSPTGATLYDFSGSGFETSDENTLQQYAINPKTGVPSVRGDSWYVHSDAGQTGAKHPGAVWFVKNQTAFIESFHTVYLYPVKSLGALKPSPFLLRQPEESYAGNLNLWPHPVLPLFVFSNDSPAARPAYSIWRIIAPGKATRVGTFSSAFENKEEINRVVRRSLVIEPSGRFMYETRADWNPSQIAVWTLDKTGKTVTLAIPPAPLPSGISPEADSQWVFVTLPSEGAK